MIYLLSSSPKNGVELMDGVEAITRGWWHPTAGSIYPLLKDMSEEGIVRKRDQDGRYELTSKTKSQFESSFGPGIRKPQTAGDMVSEMHGFVSYMEDVKNTGREDLRPHRARLKELAERLRNLAGEDEDKSTSEP